MKQFGLFGQAISHSLSPQIHQLIWQYLDISDCAYQLFDQELPPSREQLQLLHGANITIPFKEQVAVDQIDAAAQAIEAINTVYWRENKLWGTNTDWIGIDRMLCTNTDLRHCLIIGSGGAAKAVYYVLKKRGVSDHHITIAYRNHKFNDTLSHIFTKDVNETMNEYSVVFQTTPAEPIELTLLAETIWYYDLRYHIEITRKRAKNGLDMLIWQAIAAQAVWLNKPLLDNLQLFMYIKEQLSC